MPPTSHGTHYHAYLPPSVLTPLDECKLPSAKAIKLYPVPIPVSTPQRPVPKPAKPTSNRAPLTAPVPSTPIVNPPTSLPNSEAGPSRSSGRARAVPQPSVTLSQTENRRRSKRLRTDASVLGTLSHYNQTESFLSSLDESGSLVGSVGDVSFANIPRWKLPLAKLTSLSTVLIDGGQVTDGKRPRDWSKRYTLLCCVMTVDPPKHFPSKTAGKPDTWIATWRVSAPGGGGRVESLSDPVSCDVKLWSSCARGWGDSVRKGDVVVLEDVEFQPASQTTGRTECLSISPFRGHAPPQPKIVYRTMPRYEAALGDYVYREGRRGAEALGQRGVMSAEDRFLRPDLRLARSDPGIRRVAELAQWCAEWVGGAGPPM